MKPEELIPGQRYRLREGLSPSIEADLKGTDRIVELASSIPSCNEYTFMWRNYTDCIATVRAKDVKCWIPRIGEEALFWDGDGDSCVPAKVIGYLSQDQYSFKVDSGGGSYMHCKPLPKEATPVPDRNQTLTPAEAQLMQTAAVEETIAFDDDWRGRINVMMQELIARLEALEAKDNDPRYAALKKRLTHLERLVADIDRWQKNIGRAVDGLIDRMNGMDDRVASDEKLIREAWLKLMKDDKKVLNDIETRDLNEDEGDK